MCLAFFLGANVACPAFGQTSTTTTTTSTQTSPRVDSPAQTMPDGARIKDSTTAQVPDEPTTYSLADLLREENKRLKQRIESLEKENAELKAKLSGK